MIIHSDVVVGLSYGDEGKGKIVHSLTNKKSPYFKKYDYCVRFNGGGNAGHTIYHKGKKIVTHQIPVGIINGVKSIIGPGCVVNLFKLEKEIAELESVGIAVSKLLRIDKRAHVVTGNHVDEDTKNDVIGTTKQGIGPAYRDKYIRHGVQIGMIDELGTLAGMPLRKYVIDCYDVWFSKKRINILCEGAQGYGLDIDWGDYPFVTASHCVAGAVSLNGIPPQTISEVFGVCKAYDTYVGGKQFEPEHDKDIQRLREVGAEFGSTTGRPRQCNWLNLNSLERAIHVNGVNVLIINKIDVLDKVGVYKLYSKDGTLLEFSSLSDFEEYVEDFVYEEVNSKTQSTISEIIWSGSPDSI